MPFLLYLLKVSVCLAIFYSLYFFVLRHFTFHALNRLYLLGTIAISFAIPALSFKTTTIVAIEPKLAIKKPSMQTMPNNSLVINSPGTYAKTALVSIQEQKPDWQLYMVWGYVAIAAVLLFTFLLKILKIFRLSRQALKIDSLWIVELTGSGTNASFFKLIFLNTKGLTDHEKAQVIAHESVHARQWHSVDILIAELCKIVLWFNPFIYFYKKSMAEVHEFEADFITTQQFDSKNYAHLLLKLGINHYSGLSNPFSMHPLSTRIQFLFKQRTSATKKLLYIVCLPFVALGIFAFAQRNEQLVYQQKLVDNSTQTIAQLPEKDIVAIKDTIVPKNNQDVSAMVTKADTSYTKPLSIEYPALKPEINLPDLSVKHLTNRILTITLKAEKTPERYSFDFLKKEQIIPSITSEVEIKIFRDDKELLNEQDFDYAVENGTIKEVIFKPHIQSETDGVTFQLKKMMSVILTDNKNSSPWRYKTRLGEPIPFAPGVRITQIPDAFHAIDSLKKP